MLYDIRTSERAAATLETLTGVNKAIWLADKWEASKESYAIVFKVPISDTIYNGWDSDTETEMIKSYLYDAYMCICIGSDTKEILCKNGVEILPDQILECYRFQEWDR